MKIQITYFSTTGKYAPVATIITVPSTYAFVKKKEDYLTHARKRICAQRYWTLKDMEKFGYTEYKAKILNN